jgi:redox-sensitive bicupin YhaK (pirin superfamily)
MRMTELAPLRPTMRPRRSTIGPPPAAIRQRVDHLVTPNGTLRIAPLLAAMWLDLAPRASTERRQHTGLDIVCFVFGGALRYEPAGGPGATLRTESVAVLSTGAGADYRWRSVGDEPARAVMLWLLGRAEAGPRIGMQIASRAERLYEAAAIAGCDTWLPTSRDVRIFAGIVPVGGSLAHRARGRRCCILSTIGAIAANGVQAIAGKAVVIDRARVIRISAMESTEVVILETP